jgi:nitrogen fixation protein FixH
MTDATLSEGRPLTGWHVLAIFGACFGVIIGVNVLMAYDAISTFRGEVKDNPYEAGVEYNNEIAAADAQAQRHWKVDVTLAGAVRATFRDAAGEPLTGLAVKGLFAAPADMKRDRAFAMTETAPGVYVGEAAPRAGVWDLQLTAARGTQMLFQSNNRVKLR